MAFIVQKRLKDLRVERGLTLEQLAEQTKLHYNKLTEEEKQWLARIVQKSKLAKSYVPQRGKK